MLYQILISFIDTVFIPFILIHTGIIKIKIMYNKFKIAGLLQILEQAKLLYYILTMWTIDLTFC